MSDKKIIIRNCPCFNEGHPVLDYYGECLSLTDDAQVCKDCIDCVLKRIVELCKEELKGQYSDTWSLVQKISKLLDIQEVE